MSVEIEAINIEFPEDVNIILGYSHFIKTVEDLDEIIKTTIPAAKYALVFSEASGVRLIRYEGNDKNLLDMGIDMIKRIGSGHTFLILLRDAYPISILNQIKMCQEVGRIYAATSNPVKVIVAKSDQGNGVLGVIDGYSPLGVEEEKDKKYRRDLLRTIGYKK